MWVAPKLWPGETVFVLAAGPSTDALDLRPLVGRRVIAVKSAWKVWPAADVLFFADGRWWREKALRPGLADFAGLVVTTAPEIGAAQSKLVGGKVVVLDPRIKIIGRAMPCKALSADPGKVVLERSSTTGAINLAAHFGAKRIVLLGVDARPAANGRRHNHGLPWPWELRPGCWAAQIKEFSTIAPSAEKLGVEIVNANPDSAVTVWPRMRFEECL
ncbi:hypothetical protein [Mesorhizobium sp. M7A.F.Ce.TU.012.03.2.1]|uniref:hypothetical protein n=1 Tax=Mesorhizobium sp. M7A.F.Ce.TU.012.03.2.1 TaxID=2493681 RepID=UPI000FD86AF3|nr:hypothetical protein [Mesorhizobium sp. M7A.F.Ce.TU.012.03.2.1]AZV21466.1 hypothetical protein EJ079_21725 [Mesorhizobium sp. M7A.F.Ce.TU.012.03.2.1]